MSVENFVGLVCRIKCEGVDELLCSWFGHIKIHDGGLQCAYRFFGKDHVFKLPLTFFVRIDFFGVCFLHVFDEVLVGFKTTWKSFFADDDVSLEYFLWALGDGRECGDCDRECAQKQHKGDGSAALFER